MPRQILATLPLDDVEDEILYTQAALRADPDARQLLPMTDGWLVRCDEMRPMLRRTRQAGADADAARIVANSRLDRSCVAFGDELYLAVGKDRQAPRWLQFFAVSVSRFIQQALGRQVERVRGWLASKDPVLERHRPSLDRWSQAADQALVNTRALAVVRGETWQAREELASDLTRERDGLHDALSQLSRELELGRDWPDLFFRIASRGGQSPADKPAEAPPA